MNKLKFLALALITSVSISLVSLVPMASADVVPVWATKAPMPRLTAWGGTVIGPDGKVYVISGVEGRDEAAQATIVHSEMHIYTPSTNTWVTKTTPFIVEQEATAFGGDGKLYVMGGCNEQEENACLTNTVRVYNPATDSWTTRAPMPKITQSATATTGANGKIYVFGGITYDPNDFDHGQVPTLSDVNEYDPATDTWTPKASDPVLRMQTASALLNGKIYVIGGRSFTADPEPPYCVHDQCNTVEVYDPATNTWATKNNFPLFVSAVGAAVANGELYVAGGNASTTPTSGDVYKYTPATDSWQVVAQMPTPRLGLGMVTSNNKLLTIGGVSRDALFHPTYTNVVEELSFVQTDTTPPTITATKSPVANANGWNSSNVTVSFTCTDNVTVATCPGNSTVSTNGASQTVSGTATDTSGNSASTSVSVSLDKAIPTATNPTLSTQFIFFTGNLTISANAADQTGLSGVDKGLYYLDVDPGANPSAVGTVMT
jgi:N-acetylneuraminic acid mutarotase